MNQQPQTLPKQLDQKPAEDFFALRREGIGYIAEMGSGLWTDYNTHDPGITLLEAFCYALTDLAYRSGWDMRDLLMPETPTADPARPFPNQAFFSAREILTINPVSLDDFRRLLIDLEPVRNAWLFCKACACDAQYYAWCENEQLALGYRKPDAPDLQPKRVDILGLYDVLLELESDPSLGDLNDRKVKKSVNLFDADGKNHPLLLEVRFPEGAFPDPDSWRWFLESEDAFAATIRFGATRDYDVLTDPLLDAEARARYLRRHWRDVFYLDFELTYAPGGETVLIEDAALRLFGDSVAQSQTTLILLENALIDASSAGFIALYRQKSLAIIAAVEQAKMRLHGVRNLDEDFCRIEVVGIEDIAVCADVEVAADADIDRVQAQIWFALERYLNPPVPFYSLQELLDEGAAVEEIFNGPALDNGFIKPEDLAQASLRTELRTSDIVNRLMRIEGVVAVNNLLLTGYAADGTAVKGKADPVISKGMPVFDGNKTSAAWLLFVDDRRQPRLHRELSRFLFFKNGLPFKARTDEALATLVQLRGESERPKLKNGANDLAMPQGTFRHPGDYFPLQYSLPPSYATGLAGLPDRASMLRRAQAKQLKAYLMVFEQFLGNQTEQLAHVGDLFSLDHTIDRTYFVKEFSEAMIAGYDDLVSGLNRAELEAITETEREFLERRNRFLDHLLARFGERFSEYALLLTELAGQQKAETLLIETKLSFLRRLPLISANRYRSFDYRNALGTATGHPVLKKRVSLLLGYPDLAFSFTSNEPQGAVKQVSFELIDAIGRLWLAGAVEAAADQDPERESYRAIIRRMSDPDAYEIVAENGAFKLVLKNADGESFAETPEPLSDETAARALIDTFVRWSVNERSMVIEHLLLRPKFTGDALYPACSDGVCRTCGDEDPYSFRLTWVMPGWTAPYAGNLELREFADRTVRRETPAHLLPKICWVGNSGFAENPCDPIVTGIAEVLVDKGWAEADACACAALILQAYSQVFSAWFDANRLAYFSPDALPSLLKTEFDAHVTAADIDCTGDMSGALWDEIEMLMVDYFSRSARFGAQFERFERAWCQWLDANAVFDWTEERLKERIEAVLRSTRIDGSERELCRCALAVLTDYGEAFSEWLEGNIDAGLAFEAMTPFAPGPVTLCAELTFAQGAADSVKALLDDRYAAYAEVSYRLRILVRLLAELNNIYPEATVHDCDDGSDDNPVRLDRTALGAFGATQRPFENL